MGTEPEGLLALIGAQMDAAMSKLEVRLIDRFAGKKDHEDLEKRVSALERIRWQVGGIVIALVFVISTLATLSWHIWG